MENTIYCLICLKNKRCYIGVTSQSLEARLAAHLNDLKNNCHKNYFMQDDYNDFSLCKEDYVIIPLEKINCNTTREMLDCENKWIRFYKENYYRNVYNIMNTKKLNIELNSDDKKNITKRGDLDDCLKIWEMIKEGMRNRDIEKLTNYSTSFISSIRGGGHWSCKYIENYEPGIRHKKI